MWLYFLQALQRYRAAIILIHGLCQHATTEQDKSLLAECLRMIKNRHATLFAYVTSSGAMLGPTCAGDGPCSDTPDTPQPQQAAGNARTVDCLSRWFLATYNHTSPWPSLYLSHRSDTFTTWQCVCTYMDVWLNSIRRECDLSPNAFSRTSHVVRSSSISSFPLYSLFVFFPLDMILLSLFSRLLPACECAVCF